MTVSVLSESDEERAVSTIVLAFATDPGARWSSPDSHTFMQNMSGFARVVVRAAISHGSGFQTEDCAAVAVCLPPGIKLDESQLEGVLQPSPSAAPDELEALARLSNEYRPGEPHWYLSMIAVDPVYQNRGFGSALMAHVCEHFDRLGQQAYLEASSPRNLPLYRRHGFDALGTIQVGSSPTLTAMIRQPR